MELVSHNNLSGFKNTKKLTVVLVCFLLTVVITTFSQCLNNDFINMDDGARVLHNPLVTSEWAWQKIRNIFTNFDQEHYKPIVLIIYSLEYLNFGDSQLIFHATNLFFHVLNCVLVFWFVCLIAQNLWSGFITALLFGIHPLQVESVAWISELKGLMCASFYLAALITYYQYLFNSKKKYYFYALLFSVCSMMCKSTGVTIIVVLFLMNRLFGDKENKKLILDNIFFLVTTLAFACFAVLSNKYDAIFKPASVLHMLSWVFYSLTFHIWTLIYPVNLSFFYSSDVLLKMKSNFLSIVILPAFFVYSWKTPIARRVLFGLLFFLITLSITLPVKAVADRFMYIPSIGLFYIFSEIVIRFIKMNTGQRPCCRFFIVILTVCLVAILSFLSYQRCYVWQSTLTLWDDALKKNPKAASPYYHSGKYYLSVGQNDLAIEFFNKAIEIDPARLSAYVERGYAYFFKGYYREARNDCDYVIKRSNMSNGRLFDLMGLLSAVDDNDELALTYFNRAINLQPRTPMFYVHRGLLYKKRNEQRKALMDFNNALTLDPGNIEASLNVKNLLEQNDPGENIVKSH